MTREPPRASASWTGKAHRLDRTIFQRPMNAKEFVANKRASAWTLKTPFHFECDRSHRSGSAQPVGSGITVSSRSVPGRTSILTPVHGPGYDARTADPSPAPNQPESQPKRCGTEGEATRQIPALACPSGWPAPPNLSLVLQTGTSHSTVYTRCSPDSTRQHADRILGTESTREP